MKAQKTDFALLVTARTEQGKYGNPTRFIAKAELVTVAEDGSPRNISSGSSWDGTLGLEGIFAELQLPEDWAVKGERGYWDLKFAPILAYSLREMADGGRVAARVQRAMDKLDAEYGRRPETFGAFAERVAKALNVKHFIRQLSPMTYGSYDTASWTLMTPGEASRWLNDAEDAYIARQRAAVAV